MYSLWWVFLPIAAVVLFLLPFFVFKIRNEVVQMNAEVSQLSRNLATLVRLMREVNRDKIPKAKECPACHRPLLFPYTKCKECGGEVQWAQG